MPTRGLVTMFTAAVLTTSTNENLAQQSSSLSVRLVGEKSKKKVALLKKEESDMKLETPEVKRKAPPANVSATTESSAAVAHANSGRKRKRAAPP